MMLDRRAFTAMSALLLALGCGDSHMTGGDEDAAIVIPDGALRDAGTDSGPPPSAVGAACAADTDCTGTANTCLTEPMSGLPGGYCTAFCTADTDCPSDASCVMIQMGTSVCLADCDGTGTDECRAGYGCASAPGIPPVCLPGCEEDADCPADLRCQAGGGGYGAGSCYDPNASIGDACSFDVPCPMNAECDDERFSGWPGGACLGFGCDPAANTGCPDGALCVAAADGSGVCIDACASDDDCRDAYACRQTSADDPSRMGCYPACTEDSQCTGVTRDGAAYTCNPGTGYCGRPFDPSLLGDPCTDGFRGGCNGGECLTEADAGWPGGMCTYPGCSLSGASPSATCPEGSVCTDNGGGSADLGACVPSCTVGDTTCRAGYACVAVSDGSTEGACRPACTTETCATGSTCNAETGLCE